eukprot:GHVO01070125.1.p1 GENE.GHVO01070125.1~~GHVO01070125.1.p1  ORF type:complete len:512 (-),score=107.24 GHVO01070125.1:154-1689(-)
MSQMVRNCDILRLQMKHRPRSVAPANMPLSTAINNAVAQPCDYSQFVSPIARGGKRPLKERLRGFKRLLSTNNSSSSTVRNTPFIPMGTSRRIRNKLRAGVESANAISLEPSIFAATAVHANKIIGGVDGGDGVHRQTSFMFGPHRTLQAISPVIPDNTVVPESSQRPNHLKEDNDLTRPDSFSTVLEQLGHPLELPKVPMITDDDTTKQKNSIRKKNMQALIIDIRCSKVQMIMIHEGGEEVKCSAAKFEASLDLDYSYSKATRFELDLGHLQIDTSPDLSRILSALSAAGNYLNESALEKTCFVSIRYLSRYVDLPTHERDRAAAVVPILVVDSLLVQISPLKVNITQPLIDMMLSFFTVSAKDGTTPLQNLHPPPTCQTIAEPGSGHNANDNPSGLKDLVYFRFVRVSPIVAQVTYRGTFNITDALLELRAFTQQRKVKSFQQLIKKFGWTIAKQVTGALLHRKLKDVTHTFGLKRKGGNDTGKQKIVNKDRHDIFAEIRSQPPSLPP